MTDNEALLQAICADPDNVMLRLIYADSHSRITRFVRLCHSARSSLKPLLGSKRTSPLRARPAAMGVGIEDRHDPSRHGHFKDNRSSFVGESTQAALGSFCAGTGSAAAG
jgi:hypothetical protein